MQQSQSSDAQRFWAWFDLLPRRLERLSLAGFWLTLLAQLGAARLLPGLAPGLPAFDRINAICFCYILGMLIWRLLRLPGRIWRWLRQDPQWATLCAEWRAISWRRTAVALRTRWLLYYIIPLLGVLSGLPGADFWRWCFERALKGMDRRTAERCLQLMAQQGWEQGQGLLQRTEELCSATGQCTGVTRTQTWHVALGAYVTTQIDPHWMLTIGRLIEEVPEDEELRAKQKLIFSPALRPYDVFAPDFTDRLPSSAWDDSIDLLVTSIVAVDDEDDEYSTDREAEDGTNYGTCWQCHEALNAGGSCDACGDEENEPENYCDACGVILAADETHYDGEQVLCRPCSDQKPCRVTGCAWHGDVFAREAPQEADDAR